MIDLEDIRKRHRLTNLYGDGRKPVCITCRVAECDAVRLADEVERLQGEVEGLAGFMRLGGAKVELRCPEKQADGRRCVRADGHAGAHALQEERTL